MNGQTGSAGLGRGWTNLGGGSPILVSNSPAPFGGANYAQYASGSPTSIGDYEGGLGISGNNKAATVFLEFSLPGIQPGFGNATGTNVVAMNFDIDNANPPTALTGQSAGGPSAQFNYDNSTGFGFFRVLGGNTFYFASIGPTNTPYLPIPGNLYYFWFVLNASNGTYQIYLADGSQTGTNLDSGGLGAAQRSCGVRQRPIRRARSSRSGSEIPQREQQTERRSITSAQVPAAPSELWRRTSLPTSMLIRRARI